MEQTCPAYILEAATGQRNALHLELVHSGQASSIYSMKGVVYDYNVWFYVQVWTGHRPDIWVCLNPVNFNNTTEVRVSLFNSCLLSCQDWTPKHGALTDMISKEEFTLRALGVFE